MSVNFEYSFEELDNNELRINGKRTDSFGGGHWKHIIINKSWISWIITTLRNAIIDDYDTYGKEFIIEYESCDLVILIKLRERDYSYFKIFPIWNDESKTKPGIELPYLS